MAQMKGSMPRNLQDGWDLSNFEKLVMVRQRCSASNTADSRVIQSTTRTCPRSKRILPKEEIEAKILQNSNLNTTMMKKNVIFEE